ncbi:TIGR02452 family protein [Micromonospora sp. NBC_01813]|uniref:TIGR02452 family protein n=1 Tax=Micromonospora sp. NBC_01813 TaxID=2975988 RepID=UPI002DDA78CA|nr:TIGR02452 family protein [Micromonospora sp. NBC_01813]WSA10255.1 TIGR02452 family protein [Micromonospora sp. NBC_01813]
MSGRLREIARQTVTITESGRYRNDIGDEVVIGEAVRAAVAGTRHHLPDEAITFAHREPGTCTVEVTHESTLLAARRLGPGAAALVFASAKNPGGGFLGGAQAQEESIARSSALYACLRAAPEFYAFHRAQRDLRYSDRLVYSPDVPVFRDDHGNLLDQPYTTSLLTTAAPNLGAIVRSQPDHAGDVPAVLARRARRILEVAAAHGHRGLVLGAWGCGVFRNDPAIVADAFAQALNAVQHFDHVVFAIRDNLPGTPVHAAFAQRFSPAADERTSGEPRG